MTGSVPMNFQLYFIQNWWWLLLWVTSLYIYFILAFLQCHPHLISAICLLSWPALSEKSELPYQAWWPNPPLGIQIRVLSGLLAFGSGPGRTYQVCLNSGQGPVSCSASWSASQHPGKGQVRSAGIHVRVQLAVWHPDQPVGIHVRVQSAPWHPDHGLPQPR